MSEQKESRASSLISTRRQALRHLGNREPLESKPHPNHRLIAEIYDGGPWQNAVTGKPLGTSAPTRTLGTIRKYWDGKVEALHRRGTSTSDRFILGVYAALSDLIPARMWFPYEPIKADFMLISRPVDDYSDDEMAIFLERELDEILSQPLDPLPNQGDTRP